MVVYDCTMTGNAVEVKKRVWKYNEWRTETRIWALAVGISSHEPEGYKRGGIGERRLRLTWRTNFRSRGEQKEA